MKKECIRENLLEMIQSMILMGLARCGLPIVFKGGTSLSKAYGLIDRFS